MNLTDLREVLDERSTTDHVDARPHLLLAGVQGRLVVRRRNRQITAFAATAVAVLAVGAVTQAVARPAPDHPAPAATAPVPMVNGFREYADGARVIASSAPLAPGAKTLRVTFTPTSADLVFFTRCAHEAGKVHQISLNGKAVSSGTGCGGTVSSDAEMLRSSYGVRVGMPNTVTVTFPDGPPADFAVAVGEKVGPGRYVFPTRPSQLQPLDTESGNMKLGYDSGVSYQTTMVVRADPADPNRPVDLPFAWGKGAHLTLLSQTPGALTVTVDGVAIAHGEWWDYQQMLIDGGTDKTWSPPRNRQATWEKPEQGSGVVLTVKPERMTGDWAVAIQEPM
ncbi:hypothetical protein EV385_2930 [Krasilnikovia cinnamomea]|uniref:Uncharacterized protein n=1 Tax=Krasilnikovia cinnamomea TaxID=349313 RepID=A0A4Q7ZKQ6_9ACTN|nr:hypothetical protein [Krasilnikovia cinnamomea]RZU51131.1 hypothetical protein EV385_2930 [Krasilnikovia cinnamomea]